MAPTGTMDLPAPVPVPPEFSSNRRPKRSKSISKLWTVEPGLLGGHSARDLAPPRPAYVLQQRPSTSCGDRVRASTTSPPPTTSFGVPRNGQPRPSPSPPRFELKGVRAAEGAPVGTPVRPAHNQHPITPETTPQSSTIRPVHSPLCLSEKLSSGEKPKRFWTEEEESARWADGAARIAASADRVPAAVKTPKDTARFPSLQMPSPPPTPPLTKVKSPVTGIFSILSKGRKSNATTLSSTSSMRTLTDDSRPTSSLGTTVSPKGCGFIEPGGKGIVPQTDAPVSASNGGELDVSVRCGRDTVNITVNNDTNTLDILLDCTAKTTTPIDIATSTVSEMYNQLGLKRRIRPYERIRDILNSWDHSSMNCLVVKQNSAKGSEDLDAESVLKSGTRPKGFVLQLYHSQEPKKWNKRYVTLLEGGQMYSSRKPDPYLMDKDTTTLCHLSDFDVYTPTESQVKQLRPPRRYCYAIKSQQKATVFVNSKNFVHFFCTEDPELADNFHSLVRGWRSWYLANNNAQEQQQQQPKEPQTDKVQEKPEEPPSDKTEEPEELPLTRMKSKPPQILPTNREPKKKTVGHVKVDGHKVRVSVDETPYSIGAFEPLLDLGRFDKPLDEFGKDWIPDPRKSTLIQEARMANDSKSGGGAPKLDVDNSAFAAGSLLGDSYEKKKQEQKDREKADKQKATDSAVIDGPFTDGPSLLHGAGGTKSGTSPPTTPASAKAPGRTEPAGWFPSAVEHSARNRSTPSPQNPPRQTRDQVRHHRRRPANLPPPLVSLTPKPHDMGSQRSPHHHHQHHRPGGRARVPRGTTLVDLATNSPVSAFPFPPGGNGRGPHPGRRSPPRNGSPAHPMPKPLVLSPRFNQNPGRCPDFRPPPVPAMPVRAVGRGGVSPNPREGGFSPQGGPSMGHGVGAPGERRDPRLGDMRSPRGGPQQQQQQFGRC